MRRALSVKVPNVGEVEDLSVSFVFGRFALDLAPRVPVMAGWYRP
jgi:hypothetical protein